MRKNLSSTGMSDRGRMSNQLGEYLDRCISHALATLAPYVPGQDLRLEDVEVLLWPQSWPNTACGWPGVAGQAFTTAYTVVVLGPSHDAVVYLGRPAYYLPQEGVSVAAREKFYQAVAARSMPSVRDCASVGCVRFTSTMPAASRSTKRNSRHNIPLATEKSEAAVALLRWYFERYPCPEIHADAVTNRPGRCPEESGDPGEWCFSAKVRKLLESLESS